MRKNLQVIVYIFGISFDVERTGRLRESDMHFVSYSVFVSMYVIN